MTSINQRILVISLMTLILLSAVVFFERRYEFTMLLSNTIVFGEYIQNIFLSKLLNVFKHFL